MIDFTKLAQAVSKSASDAPVRFRQGSIVAVAADGTATVTVGGGTVQVAGVKVTASCCPVPGAACWLATDGRDLIVWATLAPAGPAWATMRQSVAQSIPSGAFTALDWTNRTDTVSYGLTLGNTGLTCVVPGLYQVTGQVTFAANTTGNRHSQLWVNGAVAVDGMTANPATASEVTRLRADGLVELTVGDIINIAAYQSSGGALSLSLGSSSQILRAVWIGPAT